MAPTLLAFDTSTDELHAALVAPGLRLARSELGAARASARLVPLLQSMMAEAGLRWADLDALAFGRGPGAFTGLRTACAVAQGLALGAGKPVLPIDSLMIVAEDDGAAAAATDLWVAMDARMDEVYAAGYRRDAAGGWAADPAPALYTLAALQARWQAAPPPRVAGSALAAFEGRLDLAGAARLARGPDRAAALLRVAASAWQAGQALDAADALPLYLRDKVALTTAERAAAAAAR